MAFLPCSSPEPRATNRGRSRSSNEPFQIRLKRGATAMAAQQELQVQQKREIETKEESTVPARTYVPTADTFEAQDALRVDLGIPGVEKTNIDVTDQERLRNARGPLDFSRIKQPP